MRRKKIYKIDYLSERILPVLLLMVEYIAVLFAEKISLMIQNNIPYTTGKFYLSEGYFYIIIPAVYIFFIAYTKVNERFIFFWETMQRTFYAALYSEIFCIILLYLFKTSNYVSRSYIVIFFVVSFLSIYLFRQLLVKSCNRWNILKTPVLFVGDNKVTENIIKFTSHNNCFGIKVVDILAESEDINKLKENIIRRIKHLKISTVIIAVPQMEKTKLLNLVEDIQPLVRNLMFVPDTVGIPVINLEVKKIYESNMLLLGIRNNLARKTNRIAKRIFDIVFSIMVMGIVIPVSIVVMALIMIESPGAAPIFKHYRVGKDGKLFPCYKFRSMIPNAQEKLKEYLKENPEANEEWNKYFKLKHDPRITKIGRIIRKTSIDELPQFLNVLKGEMSWVGPRPIIRDEEHYYGKYIKDYYSVLPGITGMWQVNGRSDTGYTERVAMDVWYVRNWSVWIDIALVCKTAKGVIFGKGAY